MQQTENPTNAEILAALVSGTGKTEVMASQRAISARIDLGTLARVDALAQQAKKSRNEMVNLLLDAGVQAVYNHLETHVIQQLQAREHHAIQTGGEA